MEASILKPFIRMHVEILVGGVWIEGLLMPIANSVITLVPTKQTSAFYGPTACKAEMVQAIRQVKTQPVSAPDVEESKSSSVDVRSSFESVAPAQRFGKK